MQRTYVALDVELTGLDRQRDEIVEIAMVRFRGDEVLDTFSSLVYTRRPISTRVAQLTGLSSEDLINAPRLEQLRGQILRFVSNYPVVGHSIETDLYFMEKQGLSLQNVAIDTFELASILVPEANTYSLAALSELLGQPIDEAHRALPDAMATHVLFAQLVARFDSWDVSLLREILGMAQAAQWQLWPLLQDVVQDRESLQGLGVLTPQPRPRATRGGEFAFLPAVPMEGSPLNLDAAEAEPIDVEPLIAALSPGGALSRLFPGYEYRPQQVDMLRAVAEALNTPEHLLVEAGTGTGKSLAYLLPAVQFAVQNQQRVVISSNTINLQDQLYTKDLPDVQRLLKVPLRAAILKGRGNYLCLRRLSAFRRGRQHSAEGVRVLAKVMAWLPQTRTGDQSELLLINSENAIWRELQATSETCIGDRCPYFADGRCFFHRARRRAERAHLVVVNHALLLSDLVMDSRVLPEYDYVVIDEAHHLEEQATGQFGLELARQDIAAFLGMLTQPGVVPSGLLSQIPRLFEEYQVAEPVRQTVADQIERLITEVGTATLHLDTLFQQLTLFLEDYEETTTRSQGAYDRTTSITPGLRIQPGWSELEIASDNLAIPLKQIVKGLEALANWMGRLAEEDDELISDLLLETKSQLQRGTEICNGLEHILVEPDDAHVYWVSVAQRTGEVSLHSAPIHVGEMLNERLFSAKQCVVLTSATLRTDSAFKYIEGRLGLESPAQLAVDSPFDYRSAVLLYVPKDIPEPNEPYYQRNVEQAIVNLVQATEGRALVLFTSNSQLNATYRATKPVLEKENIIVLGQGIDGSRRQILESFRSTPRSVLMGTRSFWEGVDVVGESLSCLIITRLPFAVPDDPILTARSATFEDPFNQYYLPETILRFRQGFGRLIRSKEDFGVVAVLDKRLITKSYGKTMLRALPPVTARMGPMETLPELARRWLDPERFSADHA
ncbi:MAG: helicase C-terminal domain-containing protein [Anaerolineae bacterium]|jgi:predicted DnaQ family exonuclease/DinG family helicase